MLVGAVGATNGANVAIAALSVRFVCVDVVEVGARGVEEAKRASCFGNVPFQLGELTQWLSQRREPLAPLQFGHCRGVEAGRVAVMLFEGWWILRIAHGLFFCRMT